VSIIRVYLNNFETIPEELIDDKIYAFRGTDLKSSGKIYWANIPNQYYFCIDDDIEYPKNYVKKTLSKLKEYEEDVIISYHGRKFKEGEKINNYFSDYDKFFHFRQEKKNDSEVEVIGNGVSCWNTNNIIIDWQLFPYYDMDDLTVSAQALKQKKKRIVVSHEKNYFNSIQTNNISLYEKYKNNSEKQTNYFNSKNWWG
jgi:hypothetical protein